MFCMVFIKFQESVSISRATKGVMADQYCAPDGWMQLDEGELQHRRNFIERNATWEMTPLSCPSPTHLINTISSTTTKSMSKKAAARSMDPTMLIKAHDLNVFISPSNFRSILNLDVKLSHPIPFFDLFIG